MPAVGKRWNYHARSNGNENVWEQDFHQLADCGFDLLRWQVPWSLVEPEPGKYHWDLIDPKVELANKLGLEIFYPIVHFNMPAWIAARGVRHSVYSNHLPEIVAEYTDRILSRYKFRMVIPIVEVQMDAFQRGWLGNWEPHEKSRTSYRLIYNNLMNAFRASARVARSHGSIVFCSEAASEIQTVRDLRDSIDIAGIDLYPHMHNKWPVVEYFRQWWRALHLPICVSEFGMPERSESDRGQDLSRLGGKDRRQVLEAIALKSAVKQATSEGIPIPYVGWYSSGTNVASGLHVFSSVLHGGSTNVYSYLGCSEPLPAECAGVLRQRRPHSNAHGGHTRHPDTLANR
jgi:hypothetical protein